MVAANLQNEPSSVKMMAERERPRSDHLPADGGEYAWTFGGAAPVMRITTPAMLDLYTEDCFAGRVRRRTTSFRD